MAICINDIKYILLGFFFAFSVDASVVDRIYNQILNNKKSGITKQDAKRIAEQVVESALGEGISPTVYAAILSVESNYVLWETNTVTQDYCMAQVNIFNIKYYKLDILRLTWDLKYCLDAGAKVLSYFIYRYKNLDEAIMRYNCGTAPKCIKQKRVKNYLSKVKRAF